MDISREVGLLLFETVRYLVECRNDVKHVEPEKCSKTEDSGPSSIDNDKRSDNNEIGGSKRLKGCVCVVPGTYHTF